MKPLIDRILRVEPRLGLLERRRDLLPRRVAGARGARGHRITFYEPDAFDRQAHRDIPDPDWARVVVYPVDGGRASSGRSTRRADADLLVKASGVGVFDALLEARVPSLKRPGALAVFWDVDAPATLDRIAADPRGPVPRS